MYFLEYQAAMLAFNLPTLPNFSVFMFAFAVNIVANANELEHQKEGKDYVAFGVNYNKFKSIELVTVENFQVSDDGEIFEDIVSRQFPLKADTYAATLVWGTYITDHFKTELRYGQGIASETLDDIAEINMSYWFNWYIGAAYPITDYANVFAQYGVSIFDADFTRYQKEIFIPLDQQNLILPRVTVVQPSRLEMEEDLFGTNFSTTWLVGVDFSIAKNWYWTWEYGRLLNDDASGIKVYQLNTLLKYEF
jgi:hypothetical protein